MNDIDSMPPKCHDCPYWEHAKTPYYCPDCEQQMTESKDNNAEKPMDKWTEMRETINELHESNAENKDVECVTRFLLNLMSVLDEGDDTHG